jgi:hypothetical protein
MPDAAPVNVSVPAAVPLGNAVPDAAPVNVTVPAAEPVFAGTAAGPISVVAPSLNAMSSNERVIVVAPVSLEPMSPPVIAEAFML